MPRALIRDLVERVLRDDAAVRVADPDPQLETLHRAILLEETFGITLCDAELEPGSLATPSAVTQVVHRHLGGSLGGC